MTVLTEENLSNILEYLEKSIANLATDAFDNLEIEGGIQGVKNFLENQFDILMLQVQFIKDNQEFVLEGLAKRNFANAKEIIESVSKKYDN